jgi:hypothetical protein
VATVREQEKPAVAGIESDFHEGPQDFSLVLGGPLFQIFRRARLTGDAMDLAFRRVLVISAVAWLPLLLLAAFRQLSAPGTEPVPFFRDIEVHVRFLVAVPVLILAELIVHQRLRPVVKRFVERRIVPAEDIPRFDKAIAEAVRLRNSVPVEIGLLVLVYVLGLWLWNSRVTLNTATWYAMPGGRWRLTPAGYWYVFISIPIAQFILLRWYLRLFIWFRFLWKVSRINLKLIPTHPDRCGGLAFLGSSAYIFSPVLFAQGAMLAGVVAARVLYMGQSLTSFKLQIGGVIAFFVFAILFPLVMFTPQLAAAKRNGLAQYGQLAQNYVEDFEGKWVQGYRSHTDELLGSGDMQSLADLGNSYSVVKEMRAVPFGAADISRLAAATAAPFVPLLLTVFSPEELIMRFIKLVF